MKIEKMIDQFKEKGFEVKTRILYFGNFFTLSEGRLVKGKKVVLYSEGIARRSHTQEQDDGIGEGVAKTRAIVALWKKFHRKGKNRAVHHWSMS